MLTKRLITALLITASLSLPAVSLAQTGESFPVPPGRIVIGDDTGLFMIQADGSEKTVLVENTDANCWLRDGIWSPDSAQLLYTRVCGGVSPADWHATDANGLPDPNRTARVFVYDLAANSSSELVANDGSYQDYAGDWHPDGTDVVIYSNRNQDRYNLYSVDIRTGETTQLTDFDSDVGRVSWDPSGRYLLYNRYIADTSAIRWEVRALDTTNQNEIPVAVGLTPNWSPDGLWIAYATEGESADVFVMPADCIYQNAVCEAATRAQNVTFTPLLSEREPVWSPDQTQLIYLRDTNPEPAGITWDAFRQEIRTGLLQNLTNTDTIQERNSRWEPVRNASRSDVTSLLPIVVSVRSDTANLRSSPNTNSDVVSVANRGQLAFVQGATAARDWYLITLPEDGTTAWLFEDLTEVVAGDPANAVEVSAP